MGAFLSFSLGVPASYLSLIPIGDRSHDLDEATPYGYHCARLIPKIVANLLAAVRLTASFRLSNVILLTAEPLREDPGEPVMGLPLRDLPSLASLPR
jgi:hypothetical protein